MVGQVGVEPTSIQLCANCLEGSANTSPLLFKYITDLKSVNIFFKKCDVSPSVTQLRRLNDVAGMCLLSNF